MDLSLGFKTAWRMPSGLDRCQRGFLVSRHNLSYGLSTSTRIVSHLNDRWQTPARTVIKPSTHPTSTTMISRQALHSRTTLASEAIARVHRQTGHVRGLISKFHFVTKYNCKWTLIYLTAKRYANNHTAVSFDSSTGVGVVTVTDVIRSVVLGMDIAYIRLPRVLQRVRKGGEHPIVPQRLNMHPNPMLFEDEIGHAESDKAGFYIVRLNCSL